MSPDNPELPAAACDTLRGILDRVGDKWSLYVIGNLCHGAKRFNTLKRDIAGISQRMLTLTLRGLERDGLVTRTVWPTIPPRVEYALTPLGDTLRGPVQALVEWSITHSPEIARARQVFDDKARSAPVSMVA